MVKGPFARIDSKIYLKFSKEKVLLVMLFTDLASAFSDTVEYGSLICTVDHHSEIMTPTALLARTYRDLLQPKFLKRGVEFMVNPLNNRLGRNLGLFFGIFSNSKSREPLQSQYSFAERFRPEIGRNEASSLTLQKPSL